MSEKEQRLKTTKLDQDILRWMCNGEKDIPSTAIALTLLGAEPRIVNARCIGRHNWPQDPNEFRCSHLLLETVPEARKQLHKVKALSPTWANIIDHWAKLTELYEEEKLQGESPKLHAMLEQLTQRKAA
ncbi:MAG: hypothetical protein OEY89_17395 [Gammaproteobacteria bacterium]|nr:hypothetical protein [Gammaproteobacteria bacterium]